MAGTYRKVYLDYHASTPCDPRVVEAMLPYLVEVYANPSSSIHAFGQEAATAVEEARNAVAQTVCAHPAEITFTSGATESNNLALQGVLATGKRRKVLASSIEHKAVLEPCRHLARQGRIEFHEVPVDSTGLVDLAVLIDLLDEQTAMVSIQAASNEIGSIQPIKEIAQLVHRVGAVLHTDAAQALGRIPIDVRDWGVDLLSLSAHKAYGPKGVGALFISGGRRNPHITPLMFGGGQEDGLRPGTLNVPGIVGFGKACNIIQSEMQIETKRVARQRDSFESQIFAYLPDTSINGALTQRLPGNSSLRFPGAEIEAVIASIPEIALSTGSACTSGALEPSHVLTAIGLTRNDAYSTLRIGIGRFTMDSDVSYASHRIATVVTQVRERSAA